MRFRDKQGWPIEQYKNKPILNLIRIFIHADIRATWKLRKWNGELPSFGWSFRHISGIDCENK